MSYDKTHIESLRQKFLTRLNVLKANASDHGGDQDSEFQHFHEQLVVSKPTKEDGITEHTEDLVYLLISSSTRDKVRWPNSAQFTITLDEEVDNIIKAEMVQASLPIIDPAINDSNQIIRYSFAPHATVNTVSIPTGTYTGAELALEVQTQLNLDRHAALITGGANTMDFETGYIVNGVGALEPTIEQFKVTYLAARNMFVIQNVDDSEVVLGSTVFALHVKGLAATGFLRDRADDIFVNLGFERATFVAQGTYHAGSDTYYLTNTQGDPVFGDPFAGLDARYIFGLHSNQAANLRGDLALVLDIDPLNDNDITQVEEDQHELNLKDAFGFVILPDVSVTSTRTFGITSNSYPVKKVYREGRSRVKQIKVTHRRMNGSIVDYQNADHFMVLRLTCRRMNLKTANAFTRG